MITGNGAGNVLYIFLFADDWMILAQMGSSQHLLWMGVHVGKNWHPPDWLQYAQCSVRRTESKAFHQTFYSYFSRLAGNYSRHECGLIFELNPQHRGVWICELEKYHTGFNKRLVQNIYKVKTLWEQLHSVKLVMLLNIILLGL